MIDRTLLRLQAQIRSQAVLYRLTLGTRLLLAVGFIPTGAVKLLGLRFAYISLDTRLGVFFETMYLSGVYWQFLGLTQILAGVLVLWNRTAALGAAMFLGIMANIFVITLSYDFAFTPVITALMLLATIYLLLWDYDRIRMLAGLQHRTISFPQHELSGPVERAAYAVGLVAGLVFFSVLRGLPLPGFLIFGSLAACVASFLVAAFIGLRSLQVRRTTP